MFFTKSAYLFIVLEWFVNISLESSTIPWTLLLPLWLVRVDGAVSFHWWAILISTLLPWIEDWAIQATSLIGCWRNLAIEHASAKKKQKNKYNSTISKLKKLNYIWKLFELAANLATPRFQFRLESNYFNFLLELTNFGSIQII